MDKKQVTDGGLAATQDFQELKKLLECPVCFEIPLPPIYTCKTGHAICKDCKPKLKNCVLCKDIYTDTRSFSLESMILTAKYYCANRRYGCKTKGTREELEKHDGVCRFGQITCNFTVSSKCNFSQVLIHNFYEHLKNVHNCEKLKADVKKEDNYFEEIRELLKEDEESVVYWPPILLKFDGKHFVVEWSKTESIVNCEVYLLEHDASNASYGVKITIHPPGIKYIPHYEMSMTVPSIREREIDDVEYDVAIPVRFLKKLGKEKIHKESSILTWTPVYKLYKL